MRNIWLVLSNEIIKTVTRPAFFITALGIPLIGFLIFGGVSLLGGGAPDAVTGLGDTSEQSEIKVEGYVDPTGLVAVIPESLPVGTLLPYPDEASARQALDAGEITAFYVIPADYVENGEFVYIHPEAKPMATTGQAWVMRWTLLLNLLDDDVELATRIWEPMDVQVTALTGEAQRDEDNPALFYVPYGTALLYYFILMIASSLLLNSVVDEKKNRVLEILMLSLSPTQMFTGKVVGLGITGLLQAGIWLSSGYIMLGLLGQKGSIPASFEIPFSILPWGFAFFLLGYAIYASLMSGLGALVPNMREATQVVGVVIMPLIIPLFLVSVLIQSPNSTLSLVLSLFPLTAPIAMMTRLTTGGIPIWQPLLAAGLMTLSAFLIIRAVAGMFRAQHLLSGQPFSLKRYLRVLLGQGE